MAKGTLALRQIQLGDNADTSKNFVISVPAVADGTLVIGRGNGTDVLSIAADGKVTLTPTTGMTPIGVGQTWQDVSASRAFGTTYTNNTGRPIQVSVYVEVTAANLFVFLVVDGLTVGITGSSGAANNGGYGQLTATIPNGSTYAVTGSAATRGWKELR